MNRIAIYLNQHIDGVVYSAPNVLERYSTDRSLLKFHPRIVAVPANTRDVRRLVRFSNQLAAKKISLPITVRGVAGHDQQHGYAALVIVRLVQVLVTVLSSLRKDLIIFRKLMCAND